MEVKEILSKTKDLMTKSEEFFKNQVAKVRTGRASTALVDNVKADYYGASTPISQMATISVPDAKTIVIQPWDRSTLTGIEKAIQQADLGFNPQNDGTVIRIPVPPLTEERRKEFVKVCKKYAEDSKISIRNIRREQIDILKKAEKDKQMPEDDMIWGEEEIQKITNDFTKKVDELLAKKEKELLED